MPQQTNSQTNLIYYEPTPVSLAKLINLAEHPSKRLSSKSGNTKINCFDPTQQQNKQQLVLNLISQDASREAVYFYRYR